MTSDSFRRLALQQDGAVESSHQGHADFRIRNKIFATLPDVTRAVVKLSPEQQKVHISAEPDVFSPCAGAWGLRGWTYIELNKAKASIVKTALAQAVKNV